MSLYTRELGDPWKSLEVHGLEIQVAGDNLYMSLQLVS